MHLYGTPALSARHQLWGFEGTGFDGIIFWRVEL
jgi:hypothetical protein